MKKQSTQSSKLNYATYTLLLISAVLSISAWSSASRSSAGQEKAEDKVIKHMPYPNQPIEINVEIKGKVAKLSEKIEEDEDDWLNNLSITVKNISDKTITYVGINLDFPETKKTGNMMRFPLSYGQNLRAPIVSGQPEALLPGHDATVVLSGQVFADLQMFVEKRHPLKALKKVTIHINEVSFDDGIFWSAGSLFVSIRMIQKIYPNGSLTRDLTQTAKQAKHWATGGR